MTPVPGVATTIRLVTRNAMLMTHHVATRRPAGGRCPLPKCARSHLAAPPSRRTGPMRRRPTGPRHPAGAADRSRGGVQPRGDAVAVEEVGAFEVGDHEPDGRCGVPGPLMALRLGTALAPRTAPRGLDDHVRVGP